MSRSDSDVLRIGISCYPTVGGSGIVATEIGLAMALANVAGSLVGSRLALRHGASFVRRIFIVVVGALIAKSAWDAFGG